MVKQSGVDKGASQVTYRQSERAGHAAEVQPQRDNRRVLHHQLHVHRPGATGAGLPGHTQVQADLLRVLCCVHVTRNAEGE
jgi:hypothetical protein